MLNADTITDTQIQRLYSLAAVCEMYDLCHDCVIAEHAGNAAARTAARDRCAAAINAMKRWIDMPPASERDIIGELG